MFGIVLCAFFVYANCYNVQVKIKQGLILGKPELTIFDGNLYYAFYGVPYAKPPIGKFRFKNPSPPKKLKSPFDGTKSYYGACAQSHIVHRYLQQGDEDCLYLNVYTPSLPSTNKTNSKPVVVWIHGYAFISSFSHIYGPDFFIDNDVILVTVAHRVGVFGFLKLNDTDEHANMGLKDILMALKWIRNNIKQFGGDRNQITMMGSGSGATFISLLLITKHRHLFHKVILQSGSPFSLSLFQGDYKSERNKLLDILHRKGIKNVRTASTKDIISSLRGIYNNNQNINTQQLLVPFLPILEKSHTSAWVNGLENFDQFFSKINHQILIGFDSQESITEVIPFIYNPHYLQTLATRFKFVVPFSIKCKFNHTSPTYKQVAQNIMSYYFKDGLSENSLDKFLQYSSDVIIYPIYKFIQQHLKHAKNNKMYVYKFNYIGNFSAIKANVMAGAKIKVKGAASGDEICYLLKCEPIWDNYVVAKSQNNNDVQFIKQITKLWTNFVKTGDPTPNTYTGNVTWPPSTLKNDNMLVLGKVVNVTDTKKEKRMFEFWEDIYRKYYDHCDLHDEL